MIHRPIRRLLSPALLVAVGLNVPAAVADDAGRVNLAPAATAKTSFVSGHENLAAVQDDITPRNSRDHDHDAYGNWPRRGTQWVEYQWSQPVTLNASEVYWWQDGQGVKLPTAARLSYFDGQKYVAIGPVALKPDAFNAVTLNDIKTTRLRLEFDGEGTFSTGILEWKTHDNGTSPAFPPTAEAGPDRTVVLPAQTYLTAGGHGVKRPNDKATGQWTKTGGPGDVSFDDATAFRTAARFTRPGDYTLTFAYTLRGLTANDTLHVKVQDRPTAGKLNAVYASSYKIDSPFWRDRLKNLVVNWTPHVVDRCEHPDRGQGGIDNFVEAGKFLRGEPSRPHNGYPFSNAWVLNAAESMCVALTLDAQGDPQIEKAQADFRKKLDEWIPLLVGAQEKDGYLQTRYTLATGRERRDNVKPQRWSAELRADHEGYIGGYFIELGIAHHIATHGGDLRLYAAARKLADCWVTNIGPAPKKPWYDGHQEMEQALVRLGRFVNDTEGTGGQKYIDLAKSLLDSRSHGEKQEGEAGGGDFYTGGGHSGEYDQSHVPVTRQYEAVGHAVRAAYTYSAMADIVAETNDPDYWSATLSVWDNIVNKKYYVTGGMGSGETSEGFGPDYSLPNNAYAESCSSCGLLYMQYKLNLATRQAKFADLYETTIYNAILGDVDLDAQNFTYTNPLDSSSKRYKWHVCPCCVGNIPRVLLMLPTWMYARSDDAVFVNLYAGSTVNVGKVAGADVEMVQSTDYPWKGGVAVTVNPKRPAEFTLNLRSPKREVSTLYTASPDADGIHVVKVNGQAIDATPNADGYVAIKRTWKAGDEVEFDLPLPVQTITPSDKIAATRGRVALQRGPIIYNIESVDQNVELMMAKTPNLKADWAEKLLGGVVKIDGTFANGSPLTAIPNYARLNRGGRSLVWIKQ